MLYPSRPENGLCWRETLLFNIFSHLAYPTLISNKVKEIVCCGLIKLEKIFLHANKQRSGTFRKPSLAINWKNRMKLSCLMCGIDFGHLKKKWHFEGWDLWIYEKRKTKKGDRNQVRKNYEAKKIRKRKRNIAKMIIEKIIMLMYFNQKRTCCVWAQKYWHHFLLKNGCLLIWKMKNFNLSKEVKLQWMLNNGAKIET